mgnify:CR=1 FL=1
MEKEEKKPLIILTGPTAVGKTAASIGLAKAVGGEIISADSMQVYKEMDIGSAKITPEEMEGVPHHLVDVLEPEEEFNVVRFQELAKEAMKGIYERGHIPIVVGGTGFYIQALLYDIDFTENTITIEKITARDSGKVILKEPKTDTSKRTISAPKEVIAMLKDYKRKYLQDKLQGKIKDCNLLFFDKNENPIAEDVLSKKFSRFLKKHNLKHIRFHDLRHSHVTLLINAKVPIKVISERVGHSNVNTTLNIYSHTLKEMDQEASEKISESIFKLG